MGLDFDTLEQASHNAGVTAATQDPKHGGQKEEQLQKRPELHLSCSRSRTRVRCPNRSIHEIVHWLWIEYRSVHRHRQGHRRRLPQTCSRRGKDGYWLGTVRRNRPEVGRDPAKRRRDHGPSPSAARIGLRYLNLSKDFPREKTNPHHCRTGGVQDSESPQCRGTTSWSSS